jgi:putative inorganic carbon (hco3(-)) transporter
VDAMGNNKRGIFKYGFVGFLFVLYLFLLPIQIRTSLEIRFAPSDIVLVILFFIAISEFKIRKYTFSIWHFLLVFVFGLSTLVTTLYTGDLSLYVVLQKNIGLLVLISLYFVFCHFISDWEKIRWLIRYFIYSTTFHTIIAIIFFFITQLTGITFSKINEFESRLSGMLIDPNAFGGFLVIIFTIHIILMYSKFPIFTKKKGMFITMTLILGIILTFSRSSWLALSIVLFIQLVRNPIHIVRIAVISIISLALILLISGREYFEEILSLATRSSQIDSRLVIIEKGLTLFKEAPIFGVGLGEIFEKYHIIIHNTPVWILVEFGLVGFVIFSLYLINIFLRGMIAFKLSDQQNRPLIYGLMLAYLAMIGFSFGIEALYQRHWWILMALINGTFMLSMIKKDQRM